ncbi:MAG TPA: serine/threonine-protein kinase, partial [Planctomycetia bacterium]|nr:serine/threonine-protein kinase [Planctomycetia bacterium]
MSSDLTEYDGVDGAVAGSAAPAASPPGFNLLEEIGRGGMGVVYRAADLSIGRDVALKVMNESRVPDAESVHRFLGEARITGQLQHPAIPAVHQLGTLPDGRPFLAMKLIKGRTLERILNSPGETALDGGGLTAIFEAICQAVAYAHSHRVIHRDIKPANVMVGAFGEVQVMDWGLAKVLGPGGSEPSPAASAGEDTLI